MHAKSLQSYLTLCDSTDCSPPGSSVHGILQARMLQWVAMPSSRGPSRPRDIAHVSYVSCIGRRVTATWEAPETRMLTHSWDCIIHLFCILIFNFFSGWFYHISLKVFTLNCKLIFHNRNKGIYLAISILMGILPIPSPSLLLKTILKGLVTSVYFHLYLLRFNCWI